MRNPKLLSLLRQGCTVIFPSGYSFNPIIDRSFIQCNAITKGGNEEKRWLIPENIYDLNEEGLEKALQDEEIYSDGDRDDKELALQERKEEMG